jgi:hypothetical protein
MDYGRLVGMRPRRQIKIRKLNPITVSEDSDKPINSCRLIGTSAGGENRELLSVEVGSLIRESSNSRLPAHLDLAALAPCGGLLSSMQSRWTGETETKRRETKRCRS